MILLDSSWDSMLVAPGAQATFESALGGANGSIVGFYPSSITWGLHTWAPTLYCYLNTHDGAPNVPLTDTPIAVTATTGGTFTTSTAHGYDVGDTVRLSSLTGGTGLSTTTLYYVKTAPTTTTFTLATSSGGTTVTPSTALTAGTVAAQLYVPYPAPGAYARQAQDVRSSTYTNAWIAQIKTYLDAGFDGVFIDDVNLDFDRSAVRYMGGAPAVDGNSSGFYNNATTGQAGWAAALADFLTTVYTQLKAYKPDVKIIHNAVWYALRPARWSDARYLRQIDACDYFNIEHGFADGGLWDTGNHPVNEYDFALRSLLNLVGTLHDRGKNFVSMNQADIDTTAEKTFAAAIYNLVRDQQGKDMISVSTERATWPVLDPVFTKDLGGRLTSVDDYAGTAGVGAIHGMFVNGTATATPMNFSSAAITLTGATSATATDAITLGDAATRALAGPRTAPDAITLTDTIGRVVIEPRTAPTAITLADAATRTVATARTAADAVTLADAVVRTAFGHPRTATDALTLADATVIGAVARSRVAADALTLGDAATRGTVAGARNSSDGLTLADTIARAALARTRTATDGLTLADTLARVLADARVAGETLTLADVAARTTIPRFATADDAFTLTDVAIRAAVRPRATTEALALADAAVRSNLGLLVAVADALTFAEAASAPVGRARTAADSLTLTEVASGAPGGLLRAAADALILADGAGCVGAKQRLATDGLTLADSVARLKHGTAFAIDSLSMADGALRGGPSDRNAVDSLTILEAISRPLTQTRAATDLLTVLDAAVRTVPTGALAADAFGLSDATITAALIARLAGELLTVADSADFDGDDSRHATDPVGLLDLLVTGATHTSLAAFDAIRVREVATMHYRPVLRAAWKPARRNGHVAAALPGHAKPRGVPA